MTIMKPQTNTTRRNGQKRWCSRLIEIVELLDENNFGMDFRLVHPLFSEIFSYAGEFEVLQNDKI